MKKLLTIVLILLTELTASAQGHWSTVIVEADELKGAKGAKAINTSLTILGILKSQTGRKIELSSQPMKVNSSTQNMKWQIL